MDAGYEPSRRRFIARISAVAGASGLLGTNALVVPAASAAALERSLSLRSIHTQEVTEVTYWRDGRYLPKALAALEHQLRDHRTGNMHAIDPRLYDVLVAVQHALGRQDQYEVISGYRSPQTNRMLSGRSSRVAKKSLHMRGLAIDVRLPGTPLRKLRDPAVGLNAGGLGYYSSSGFIHVDLGRPRAW